MRFYIHVKNGVGFLSDEEGSDHADLDAAEHAAIQAGAEIIADEIRSGCRSVEVTLFIEGANHTHLAELPMTANINLTRSC